MTKLEYRRLFDSPSKEEIGGFPIAMDPCTGDCPKVNHATGGCTAYEKRPLICRLYGVAPGLTCPHVKAEKRLTDIEATVLLAESERISEEACGAQF
jgi:Fe-S-cluster containining protein